MGAGGGPLTRCFGDLGIAEAFATAVERWRADGPAPAVEARVALTLRMVRGLTVPEIARAS